MIRPFDDRPKVDIEKSIQRATPKQTNSDIDLSLVDGSSLKTASSFGNRTIFTSVQEYEPDGTISHEIKQHTFGQIENGQTSLTAFDDRKGKFSAASYIDQPPITVATLPGGDIALGGEVFYDMPLVDNGIDFSFRDGRIDVVGTLDSIPYVTAEGDQIAKGVRGAAGTMSDFGNDTVEQLYDPLRPGTNSPFVESSDTDFRVGNFVLARPGINNNEPGFVGSVVEQNSQRVDDFYFLTITDYGLIPSGSRSAGAGFTYANCQPGTDSVAFGGFRR